MNHQERNPTRSSELRLALHTEFSFREFKLNSRLVQKVENCCEKNCLGGKRVTTARLVSFTTKFSNMVAYPFNGEPFGRLHQLLEIVLICNISTSGCLPVLFFPLLDPRRHTCTKRCCRIARSFSMAPVDCTLYRAPIKIPY